MEKFKINSIYNPSGDQPKAINQLVKGLNKGDKSQMLLGITGSGKTFTMAHVIATVNRPALIMVHNKTLAAQIYSELKELFPNNYVEYFVSYYDYYQPEAYIARTDTYIEKDSSINEKIDLLRHSATRSLLERKDVIVVSSVSCIYGLGSPEIYYNMTMKIQKNQHYEYKNFLNNLVELQYTRNNLDFQRGNFRVRGDTIDVFPSHYATKAWKFLFSGNTIDSIIEFDPLTNKKQQQLVKVTIYANSHFITPAPIINNAILHIKKELEQRLQQLKENNQLVELQRLKQRTNYDIEMLKSTGSCKGIENYSRFLTGRKQGDPPPTLFEYLPKEALLFVDESHVTVPQIKAMYNGDRARKSALVDHGFRLPSALDNRPLKFSEWVLSRPQTIFVSATPGDFELNETNGVYVELIIRPTGLLDPECIIKPATNQVDDLIDEINQSISKNHRILVTTLAKKMAEDLSSYLADLGYNITYLHSTIQTLERVEIINQLRLGKIDIIVGVNLLREGLNIPECGLVAILDADKEGFLRSKTSLIQTIGRAARNIEGKVILYADNITQSIISAVNETKKRRAIQKEYNDQHNIIPQTINSTIHNLSSITKISTLTQNKNLFKTKLTSSVMIKKHINRLKLKMHKAAANLEFEQAASIRDQVTELENIILELD